MFDGCNWIGNGSINYQGEAACSAGFITMQYEAMGLSGRLADAGDPESDSFLGRPPAELAVLVQETRDSADQLVRATQATDRHHCVFDGSARCGYFKGQVFQKMSPMESALAAWASYL
jgi:hypothetical protein